MKTKQVIVRIPAAEHRDIKLAAANRDQTIREMILEAVRPIVADEIRKMRGGA